MLLGDMCSEVALLQGYLLCVERVTSPAWTTFKGQFTSSVTEFQRVNTVKLALLRTSLQLLAHMQCTAS